MSKVIPPEWQPALATYGPLADKEAKEWGLSSGAELVAKVHAGESGFRHWASGRSGPLLTSSANAKGAGQFIPGTRQSFIDKYGVDAWKSPADAVHATALYMRDLGLARYNPGGGQGYINYILGQPVAGVRAIEAGRVGQLPPASGTVRAGTTDGGGIGDDIGAAALKGLLWVGLVGGGAALAGIGTARLTGVRNPLATRSAA